MGSSVAFSPALAATSMRRCVLPPPLLHACSVRGSGWLWPRQVWLVGRHLVFSPAPNRWTDECALVGGPSNRIPRLVYARVWSRADGVLFFTSVRSRKGRLLNIPSVRLFSSVLPAASRRRFILEHVREDSEGGHFDARSLQRSCARLRWPPC